MGTKTGKPFEYNAIIHIKVKKESPNMGTKALPRSSLRESALPVVEKESPNMGRRRRLVWF